MIAYPNVSVVVPTHGRPAGLQSCVEALRALDYRASSLQIVVVVDGGPEPDLTADAGGPDLTVLRQANQGPAAARNHGAREARGEILAFTDDDCRPRPAWLRLLVGALTDEPSAMAGGRTANGLPGNIWAQASQDLLSFLYGDFYGSADGPRRLRPFMMGNNFAMRRDRFLELGGFDAKFPLAAAEDRDLSERWVEAGGALRLVPDAVVDHHSRLNAWSFMRQHYRYGRGSVQLARRRRGRGHRTPGLEPPSFYARMISYPVRKEPGPRGVVLSGLVAGSQFCGAAGMVREVLAGAPAPSGPGL